MEKQSLGLIETVGLVPAIEAADAGSKAANVIFRGMKEARAGLITVMFVGDVAAVRAAVTAGAAAARLVGNVVSLHVIPRPDRQLHVTSNDSMRALRAVAAPAVEEPRKAMAAAAPLPLEPKQELPPTLAQAEEKVEMALDQLTPEATQALDEQVESIVQESECVGGNEVSVEEAEVAGIEQPQDVAEVIEVEEAPPEPEPEVIVVGRTAAARKKDKDKIRKPRSKRKF